MFQDFEFSCNFEQVINMDAMFDDSDWNIADNLLAPTTSLFFEPSFGLMENGE